jgi:choline monooxygenase
MSDLSTGIHAGLAHTTQLPVSVYFDEALLAYERELIFDKGPKYLGHELAVPTLGDYYALPQENEGRVLLRRSGDEIVLLSNVCRHRQAVMLRGRGSIGSNAIVCPLHRWTYKTDGQLIGAPHFAADPCLNLKRYTPQRWNGMLFDDNGFDIQAAMRSLDCLRDFDFSGYVLDHVELHECAYNWKTFVEVYLEDYHVGPFHPGLGQFVSCDDLRWQFADWYSVQTVGIHRALSQPGSPVYKKWHEAVLNYRAGQPPEHGAIWLTIYPNITVEWYPSVLVISALHPISPQRTLNVVEFYYPEEIAAFERHYIDAQQAAYKETMVEDDEIAIRMDAGRKALLERGDNEVGPYQTPMEDGMVHFHQWYRRLMGERLPG